MQVLCCASALRVIVNKATDQIYRKCAVLITRVQIPARTVQLHRVLSLSKSRQ